eukprot:1208213-Lingulodinium_polyedra.AAC.1
MGATLAAAMGLSFRYFCSTGKGGGGGEGGQSPGPNSARERAPFRGPPFARLEKRGGRQAVHFGGRNQLHDYGGARNAVPIFRPAEK